jgi:hypothetical protein
MNGMKKVIENLRKIEKHNTAPINLVKYRSMGLITVKNHYYTDASGNQEVKNITLHLTEKGKRIADSSHLLALLN